MPDKQSLAGGGTAPRRSENVEDAAEAGLTDISIKVRLIAAFVLIAAAALSVALVVGMALDGVLVAVRATQGEAVPTPVADAVAYARSVGHAAAGATAILAVVMGAVIAFSIANPIQRITWAMSRLSKGDTDIDIPQSRSADEIGVLASTIAAFRDKTLEVQRLISEREEEERWQAVERRALRERLGADLEATVVEMVDKGRENVSGLRRLSDEMLDAQKSTSQRTAEVGEASSRASSLAGSFADAVDDLSGAIHDIENRVEQTSDISDQAAEDARQADSDINALVQAADSITEIIDLINDIAGKTNMLALNATVEAVRAGEAGRSFQVVAHEIKNLSRQTADATKQVEGHIADIRGKTDNTAKRVRGIIDVIGMINTAATEIKGAVEQQSRTAAQISRDAQEASEQTRIMQDGVHSVASQAERTEAAAAKVRDSADGVGRHVDEIREEVDRFLNHAVKDGAGERGESAAA